jgi:hypothetical protein
VGEWLVKKRPLERLDDVFDATIQTASNAIKRSERPSSHGTNGEKRAYFVKDDAVLAAVG